MRRSPLRRPPVAALALLAITAGALALRLWNLGWRVAHQDEGRVGDLILHYVQSGHWEYDPIVHGPFLPHVNGVLFPIIGANDFTARLIVAAVGGVLPLAAWLFRARLRDEEVVALGAFLALNPVLVYYSRFMRNDVLLAAFALFALGFAVRALDTDRPLYLYPAALSLALGFTTKENALLYPVAWAGALALVADERLLVSAVRERVGDGGTHTGGTSAGSADGAADRLFDVAGDALRGVWAWRDHVAGSLAAFAVTVVLFYAPLPDLWQAFGDPTRFPAVIEEATLGSWNEFMGTWASPGMRDHSYLDFVTFFFGVLATAALPVCALAAVGFLYDRWAGEDRALVAFAAYWGAASAVAYPIVMDIQASWVAAHVVVPLAIPAAVGAGALYRRVAAVDRVDWHHVAVAGVATVAVLAAARVLDDRGVGAVTAGEPAALAAAATLVVVVLALFALDWIPAERRPPAAALVAGGAAALLLVAAVTAGAVTYDTSFESPQSPDNPIVQYAQPSGQMQGTLADIDRIADERSGVHVTFYGDENSPRDYCNQLVQPTEEWSPPESPPCGWFSRLPLPWYFTAGDVTTDSSSDAEELLEDPSPVVIALGSDGSGNTAADLDELTEQGYERESHQGYLWGRELIFFVDQEAAGRE